VVAKIKIFSINKLTIKGGCAAPSSCRVPAGGRGVPALPPSYEKVLWDGRDEFDFSHSPPPNYFIKFR
jgi:hypothetical protein